MTNLELLPLEVGTFRLKRGCPASAGGHLPQCKRVGRLREHLYRK
jgi:hypothetical protein